MQHQKFVKPMASKAFKILLIAWHLVFLFEARAQTGLNIPYCDNFNGANIWQQASVSGTPWQKGGSGSAYPPSIHSAPSCWIIGVNGPYATLSQSYLYSPKFNFVGYPIARLSFWYHSNTENWSDGVRLEFSTDSINWTLIGGLNDSLATAWYNGLLSCSNTAGWMGNSQTHAGQVNGWVRAQYLLTQANAGNAPAVWFRFVFCSNTSGNLSGFAIDDFCILPVPPVDAQMVAVTGPGPAVIAGGCLNFNAIFKNDGSQNITQANFSYSVNGGTPLIQSWNGLLLPGTVDTVSFPCIILPAGTYSLCVHIDVAGDTISANDTLCITFTVPGIIPIDYTTPYCDDFESGPGFWSREMMVGGQAGTLWERGMPAFGATTGTFSGVKCWDINLNTGYQSNAKEALYSPYFDFTLTGLPALSFAMNINSEFMWDGLRMDYTIDSGLTWQVLGTANAPPTVATNWYTNVSLNSSQKPGWSGVTPSGFISCTYHNLSFLNGEMVRFRFVFTSDPSVNTDGVSIDDFCLYDIAPNSAQPVSVAIISPFSIYPPGPCYPFTAKFKNSGSAPLNSLTAELRVDGSTMITVPVNFSSPIPSGGTSPTIMLPGCWTAIEGTHNICLVTSNPNGQPDLSPYDDTICFAITIMDLEDLTGGTSFCSDFESAPKFLAVNGLSFTPVSSWKYGTPAKTFINGAYSGNKAWITSLNQSYPANDNSALLTGFFKLNTNTSYRISFRTKFKTEYLNDGGTIQFSTDYFNTWYHFGNPYYPQWMNTSNIFAHSPTPPPNVPGWSGQSTGWQNMEKIICFPDTAGNSTVDVVFRFLFKSDIFTQDEGWAIDDFCLVSDPAACVIGTPETEGELPEVSVSPNPFSTQTTITLNAGYTGKLKMIITDLSGKVIINQASQTSSTGAWTYKIPRGNLDQGIYFYTIQMNQQSVSGKLIVIGEE